MNQQFKTISKLIIAFLIILPFNLTAQIQDIKKNSKENKTNHSNNNSNSNSSNNNSSNSDSDNSDLASGCFSMIFDLFTGCLSSLPEKNHNNYSNNEPDDFIVIIPEDKNDRNNKQNSDNEVNNNSEIFKPKSPKEFSLDLKANFALGYQYGSDSSYTYYNFLPAIRANLAWFLIDYRYNMLAEISDILPDAFKTWDLLFLIKINADANTKIIFGTGMHHEEYSGLNFNEHFLEAKIGLFENRDFIDVSGKLAIDYKTSEYPFSEVGINYNRRIINSKNLNGYISVGGHYQNYYSAVDIWAFKAGININWHN